MPDLCVVRKGRAHWVAALVAAVVVGSLAGYAAYQEEAEAQFHGGVLPEDAAQAQFELAWQFASAFARWGLGAALIAGVAAFALRRLLKRVA